MINSKIGKANFKIIPGLGGIVSELNLFNGKKAISLIDSYPSIDDEISRLYYKSHFLLPFPNRLMDGKYTFEGKTYQFPINDIANNHNLHGFSETVKMMILSNQTIERSNVIQLKGAFEGTSYYPFSFEIFINYTFTENSLAINTKIENIGKTNMPIGFGWHPYFKLDIKKIDELSLQLPTCERIEIDNRMMPTGELSPFDTFNQMTKIKETEFDNCFIINKSESRAEVILKSETTQLTVWQETGENACNYFQIYTPEHRQSIAIEPMSCNVDTFNNQEGLQVLAPNEIFETNFGVEIS